MHGILRMVARLLLGTLLLTMTAALPGAEAMPFAAVPAGHALGCHDHAPVTPSPVPTRYQCCVIGHHAAVQGVAFSLRFARVQVGSANSDDRPRLALLLSLNSSVSIFPSDSPPGAASLRI